MVSMAAPMSVTTKLEPASPLWQRLDGTWTQPFRLPGPTSHGAELTYGGHRSRWRPCTLRRPGSGLARDTAGGEGISISQKGGE